MYLLPLLNIKSLPMLNMLVEAKASGKLDGVHTLVENSSGNAAFSLAVLATLFDIPRTMAILPWDIAPGKLELLRVAGVETTLKREDPFGVIRHCRCARYGRATRSIQCRAIWKRCQSGGVRKMGCAANLGADKRQDHGLCRWARHDGNSRRRKQIL